jgi:hypothetical protein
VQNTVTFWHSKIRKLYMEHRNQADSSRNIKLRL